MRSIPHYKSIMLAMQEGVTSMAENIDLVGQNFRC
jgi:hypothetical protein